MNKLSFNSIDPNAFRVMPGETGGAADLRRDRADIITEGRLLYSEYARKGVAAIRAASGNPESVGAPVLSAQGYAELNRKFQQEHLLYCAKRACAMDDMDAPEDYAQFRAMGQRFYANANFLRMLQGIYQEIITPIAPRVYSEAVDTIADTVELGFGETHAISVGSGDIPVFQDSAWGSARSVPANRFYSKDITLNPQPKTAEIRAKWMQMVGNNMDFGAFFSNIVSGMYAKTMAMWANTLAAATSGGASYIPAGLTGTFNQLNWVTIANKLSAANNTTLGNLFATGSMVALSKVLPTQVTGSTNVTMDAAIATLLGAEYTRGGYLGQYMGVRLLPMMDALKPGTQFTTVDTVLSPNDIYMMSGNGRKPLTIAYNSATPIQVEIRPENTASFEYIVNLTIALDVAAVFSSRVGMITV